MAAANSPLSEDQFLCTICLDVFTEPISTPCGHHYCKACITRYWDTTSGVCKCPNCNRTFDQRPEVFVNTFISEMVDRFWSLKLKEEENILDEVQQMIQERQVKIQEVKRSVQLSRKDADAAIVVSVQVLNALIRCIERSQADLIDLIEEKQKTTEQMAEGVIKDLQQEVIHLAKRKLNSKQASREWRPMRDWTKVNVRQSSHVGALRTQLSQLEKTLSQEMKKQLCGAELRRIQRYEVDVTLDPDTAHPKIILSEDGKQVSVGDVKKNLPDNTKRFSRGECVLGKQSFSSGMFYYEVQVGGKTEWALGVAKESINRKRVLELCPNNGYWTIGLLNGKEYEVSCDLGVLLLPVRGKLQKVGVFVDYEERMISFYDVESRVHLYTFTGCTFNEKLYTYFYPGLNEGGRNSDPLIISPVNHPD